MKIKSIREILQEKVNSVINAGWNTLTLDDDTQLMTNLELIDKQKIQICLGNETKAKTYVIKKSLLDLLKDMKIEVDTKDDKVIKFLELYPCSCS